MENRTPTYLPPDEQNRLQSTLEYEIIDTPNEEQLDALTSFTASVFNVPIALITILDQTRQWFKSNYGLNKKETERSISFCQFTIIQNDIFEVEDTLTDERFVNNPLVIEDPFIRYYCGTPLTNEKGYHMGSLAIIDRVPRRLSTRQRETLKLLGQQVVNFFELHMKRRQLQREKNRLEERVAERTIELEQKITELKNRDDKIISMNNELNRLIYRASHDLLGPLRTFAGLIQLALSENQLDNIQHYLKLLQATEQKLEFALINLLRIVSIKEASDYTIIKWDALFDSALKSAKEQTSVKPVILKKQINLSREFYSDPLLLEMIFAQLFANSIQYNMNEPVLIELEVSEDNENISIRVNDNGIGIRDDEKDKIFEMFFKNPKSRGSGLGLYVAKNAIEKLSGKITVDSRKNQGTEFTITLPVNVTAHAS